MSNTIGNKLKLTIFGQSHAPCVGAVIEGLPAGMAIDTDRVRAFMARRAPGGELSTARREADEIRIVAGLNEAGRTCGAPLCAVIENADARPGDYEALRDLPRPGHADYTAWVKFGGRNDVRGGGQFSGRLTAPLCFAGALCLQFLEEQGVHIAARIASVADVDDAPAGIPDEALLRYLSASPFPTLDAAAGEAMRRRIAAARDAGDSVGGVLEVFALGVPAGLGDPMFDGMENALAAAAFGIPGVRGVEFGEGFRAARMRGSEHNDAFRVSDGRVVTATDRHGGILGGITSGMPIVMRLALKPTPSIALEQDTVSLSGMENARLRVEGRHDPCIAPRAVPCAEAVMALVLADKILQGR